MKKILGMVILLVGGLTLAGCSSSAANEETAKEVQSEIRKALDNGVETGDGTVTLETETLHSSDNTIKLTLTGYDETKKTFIYVANTEVLAEKVKNDETISLAIQDVAEAHSTTYDPKVQVVQYQDDDENSDITMFKEVHYKVTEK